MQYIREEKKHHAWISRVFSMSKSWLTKAFHTHKETQLHRKRSTVCCCGTMLHLEKEGNDEKERIIFDTSSILDSGGFPYETRAKLRQVV